MAKIFFTSDWHLTDHPQDEYRWGVVDWTIRNITNRQADALFILGDVTHSKDSHPSRLVNRLVDSLQRAAKICPVFVLMGNHDYTDPKVPFFDFLNSIEGIRFIKDPRLVEVSGARILCLPHAKNGCQDWSTHEEEKVDFIVCHQSFDGAESESGHRTGGVDPRFFNERWPDAEILAGDIHVPQKIYRVRYVGAPHPINFGDNYKTRGLFYDGKERSDVLRISIRKLVVNVIGDTPLKECGISQGDQIKVVVTIPRSEFSDWEKHRNRIIVEAKELGIVLCGLELKEKKADRPRLAERESRKEKAVDPVAVLTSFCTEAGIDKEILEVGRGLVS